MCTEGCKQTQDQVDRLLPSTSLQAILPALRNRRCHSWLCLNLCRNDPSALLLKSFKKDDKGRERERACGRGEGPCRNDCIIRLPHSAHRILTELLVCTSCVEEGDGKGRNMRLPARCPKAGPDAAGKPTTLRDAF